MKKSIIILTIFIAINSSFLFAQVNLTIEGKVVNNTETGSWNGVNIQRSSPTAFIYRNNSITSANAEGYMLQAGDESVSGDNNHLDGAVISGNKLVWKGTDANSITHGIFTGHNKNVIIKYNYLERVPMSIIRKSTNGMTNTSGGVAYNIIKNPIATAGVVKGMNNVSYYNNTIYSNVSGPWRGLIDIYTNTDITPSAPATGAKIKNNIFYTVNQIYNIAIHDAACLPGFESDYNVFYCESGTPVFNYLESRKTFAQWQALGYDQHSVVINPNFINTVDFVPAARLDHGTDLGTAWQAGLSTAATWTTGSSPATANQNGKWQVGARIYNTGATSPIVPTYVSAVIENATPSVVEMTYSSDLANIIPASSAFNIQVNSVARIVNTVSVSGQKVRLTLTSPVVYGDIVKVTYTKPSTKPIQTASGGQAASISAKQITNNIVASNPQPAKIKITIYPNPAHRTLNITLEYTTQETGTSGKSIRILDISGKVFLDKSIDAAVTKLQYPINFKPGIYAVVIMNGSMEVASQTLIVN